MTYDTETQRRTRIETEMDQIQHDLTRKFYALQAIRNTYTHLENCLYGIQHLANAASPNPRK